MRSVAAVDQGDHVLGLELELVGHGHGELAAYPLRAGLDTGLGALVDQGDRLGWDHHPEHGVDVFSGASSTNVGFALGHFLESARVATAALELSKPMTNPSRIAAAILDAAPTGNATSDKCFIAVSTSSDWQCSAAASQEARADSIFSDWFTARRISASRSILGRANHVRCSCSARASMRRQCRRSPK